MAPCFCGGFAFSGLEAAGVPHRTSPGPTRARAVVALGATAATLASARSIVVAQTPAVVRVGSGNVEANAQVFYAIEQGFFKKAGIDAQLTILRNGSVTMEAIIAGQLDAGVTNTGSLGLALLRQFPFVVIAPGQVWDARAATGAIVVAKNSPFKTAKDLEGQTLGVLTIGSFDQAAFEAYLDQNGADKSTVKYFEGPPAAMAEMVASGRVGAGLINDPELSNALAAGTVRRFADAYNAIARLFVITEWLTTRDWLAKNKDVAKRFADALVAAGAWGEANREQALVILAKYTKFKEDRSLTRYGRKLDPALLQPVFDTLYKYKIYSAPLRAADFCWDGKAFPV